MRQEKKLVIELKHPNEIFRMVNDVMGSLSQAGLSKEEIQQQNRIIKAANSYGRVLKAYMRSRKLQLELLPYALVKLMDSERS
jgi:L-lysine 2,3-aminomutase